MDEQELDWLKEIDVDDPVIAKQEIKKQKKHKFNYSSQPWKYYLTIRTKFAEWWEDFNGSLDSKTRHKYRNLRKFVDTKTKNKQHREWLMFMLGPRPRDEDRKRQIPYVGDWVRRRKNGYWTEENKYQIKGLAKAIKDNLEKGETIRASAPFLIQELCRVNRLIGKLDELFAGSPFLDDSPKAKGQVQRFEMWAKMYETLLKFKVKCVHEIMRVHGVNPDEPNQMWNMGVLAEAVGRAGAAGALTGVTAAGNGQIPGLRPDQFVMSRSAMLMADHLQKHAKVFGVPLPQDREVVEGEVIKEHKKEKSNGHTKAN